MSEFLETIVDKFIFRVARDRYYNAEGLWAMGGGNLVRIGLSDFLQQRSGDVAFAEVQPAGTQLDAEDTLATIETIKVDIDLVSPIPGTIFEVNPGLEDSPELINQDPYGEGWLIVLETSDWETRKEKLMKPQAYLDFIRGKAQEELGA